MVFHRATIINCFLLGDIFLGLFNFFTSKSYTIYNLGKSNANVVSPHLILLNWKNNLYITTSFDPSHLQIKLLIIF